MNILCVTSFMVIKRRLKIDIFDICYKLQLYINFLICFIKQFIPLKNVLKCAFLKTNVKSYEFDLIGRDIHKYIIYVESRGWVRTQIFHLSTLKLKFLSFRLLDKENVKKLSIQILFYKLCI
jgi:hypothetical protein